MGIEVRLTEDPKKLELLRRIAVAVESIAKYLKPMDPDDAAAIAAATDKLNESGTALGEVVKANPVPKP